MANRQNGAGLSRRTVLRGGAGLIGLAGLSACAPSITAPSAELGDAPIAATRFGDVRGLIDSGIYNFRGVRYGAPTRRFQPPVPPAPWKDAVDAFEFSAQAPQALGAPTSLYRSWSDPRPSSEDCLFLNVWSPALDAKKRPVIVSLHGIGLSTGSGASKVFDGTRLCQRGDVVVVTLNHRVNLFGHLYLARLAPEFPDSGNVGLLDIILALGWVRDNIAAFGGDPGNVTLLGQSAGGMKASALMAMPKAQGLFHRVIVQSGSGPLRALTPEEATANAVTVLASLGLTPSRASELKSIPMEELLAANGATTARPMIDIRSLARNPFEPDAPGISARIPMLIGTTRNEQSVLTGRSDPSVFTLGWGDLPTRLASARAGAQTMIGAYRKLYPHATPTDVFFALKTDSTYWRDAVTQAERKAAQHAAPVFMYQLDWATPVDGGKWGAPHALDLPLVFDNVARSQSMVGASPQDQAGAQKLADQMSAAWIAFARSGNPNTAALPHWPAYDSTTRATMAFNTVSAVVNDPRKEERLMFTDSLIGRS